MAEHDDDLQLVLNCALTFAQFAGFAIPYIGVGVAGGAAVLQTVLTKVLSQQRTTLPLGAQIVKAMEQVLVQHDITDARDDIQTYYMWFRENYNSAWENELSDASEYQKEFETTLHQILEPTGDFLKDMTRLMDPEHRDYSFSVVLLGASFHLTLLSIAVLLDQVPEQSNESRWYRTLVKRYEDYINHAQQVVLDIAIKVNDRQNLLTFPKLTSDVNMWIPGSGNYAHVLMYDNGVPGEPKEFRFETMEEAMAKRAEYFNDLRIEVGKRYFGLPLWYGNDMPLAYAQVVEKWQKDSNQLKANLPPPHTEL
jgi:hypothetical protein